MRHNSYSIEHKQEERTYRNNFQNVVLNKFPIISQKIIAENQPKIYYSKKNRSEAGSLIPIYSITSPKN